MLTVRRNFLASSVKIFLQITVRLVKLPTTWLGQDDVKGKVKKQRNWWVPQCFWKTCYLYHKSSISGFRVLCFVGVMILFSCISWKRMTGSSTHVVNTLFFFEHLPWWGKVFTITRAPQFTASTPTVYIQNNNPLQLWQVDFSSIHFKLMKEGKISYSFDWPSLHLCRSEN